MKHELVHRYTCEGCGETVYSAEELDEFGHHSRRRLGGYIRNSTADTEAQCKEYRAEEKRWMLERDQEREANTQSLIAKCAQDAAFCALISGDETAEYASYRMSAIAREAGISIDDLTFGSGYNYDCLLTKCVDAAREKVTTHD